MTLATALIPALTRHRLAALFPMLEGQPYTDLRDDISKHGLLNQIVVADGVLLDGRNRLKICEELNIEPVFVEFSNLGLNCTPEEYIWSQNMARRHLTDDQRASIAIQWAEQIKADAKDRQLASLKRGKENPVRADSPARDTSDRHPTRKKLAQVAQVSEHKIRQAAEFADHPTMLSQVASGKMKLKDAVKRILPEAPQSESASPERVTETPTEHPNQTKLRKVPGEVAFKRALNRLCQKYTVVGSPSRRYHLSSVSIRRDDPENRWHDSDNFVSKIEWNDFD